MSLFPNVPLKRKQLRQIIKETGCSKESAMARAEAAVNNGMPIAYFMANQFYKMSPKELSRYLSKGAPRRYVEALKAIEGEMPDFEIYSQIKRAKKEYGIPYRVFVKQRLLNASDDRLEKAQDEITAQEDEALSSIAASLAVSKEEAQAVVDRIKSKFGYDVREINRNGLYLMTDEDISQWKAKKHRRQQDILSHIEDATGWSKSKIRAHMSHCLIDFGIASSMYYCLRCYEMPDWKLALCANTRDSKRLSSKYNSGHGELLDDKTRLYGLLNNCMNRKYWFNQDTSFEEFLEFADGLEEVFCKPVDSKAGTGAYKYRLSGKDPKEAYEHFMNQPKYLIEECVEQHPDMAKFYPDSINTVRLIAILDDDTFDPFLAVARFGVDGVVDNFTSGGIACGVDPKTGLIGTDGCNKYGDVFETHPVTGKRFKGFQIPHWDKVIEIADSSLRAVDGIDFVGWDFAIQDDGVTVIEGNAGPGFTAPQTAWFTEGRLVRDSYYKHLGMGGYEDMLFKVTENMKKLGLTEQEATDRLVEAYKKGLDYAFVEQEEICRMTPEQIKIYSSDDEIRETTGRLARADGVSVAEAFLRANS